jgi:hypothetical protein
MGLVFDVRDGRKLLAVCRTKQEAIRRLTQPSRRIKAS